MKRTILVLGMLAGLLALLACGETSTVQQAVGSVTQAAPTATHASTWQTVQHFSGNQNAQTDSFAVHDGDHVVWKVTPTDPTFNSISVILEGGTDGIYELVLNTGTIAAAQSGTYTVHADGDAYFSISAINVTYDLTVQHKG